MKFKEFVREVFITPLLHLYYTTMIEIRIQGKLLTHVRHQLLDKSYFSFMYDLVKGLYESRDKTVDIAFMMYLDRISYSYLRAFYFAEELPNVPFTGKVEFRKGEESVEVDVTSLFESEKLDTATKLMEFGADLRAIL